MTLKAQEKGKKRQMGLYQTSQLQNIKGNKQQNEKTYRMGETSVNYLSNKGLIYRI